MTRMVLYDDNGRNKCGYKGGQEPFFCVTERSQRNHGTRAKNEKQRQEKMQSVAILVQTQTQGVNKEGERVCPALSYQYARASTWPVESECE